MRKKPFNEVVRAMFFLSFLFNGAQYSTMQFTIDVNDVRIWTAQE